ncbi:MAG: hypothetical protein GQ573_00010 [Gammaproteobacteria bacterium]|nr:hypothetical protein [Gammaproteobacteria bacterium]
MDLSPSLRRLIILVCLYTCLLNNVALADDRQVIDYSYDSSGNLLEKITDVTFDSLPPVISSIKPSIVRRNTSTLITLDGNYLKNLQVSTDYSGLSVSNVESTNSRVTFNLNISADVPLGMHAFIFSTLSGQVSQTIQVFPQLPEMVIRPSPLAVIVGKETEITFGISHSDVVDHQITVSVADQSIASTAGSQFVIVAGERFPAAKLSVAGLQTGTTRLTFSSQELGTQIFTLIVGNVYQPPPGSQINVSSDSLGLVLPSNSPDINELGPFTSSISVFLTPVFEPNESRQQLQLSPLLNVVFGSAFTELAPKAIAENKSSVLVIKGHGLSDVTDITINPADGVVLGELQINQAATEITVPVSTDAGIAYSARFVKLFSSGTEIKPVSADIGQIFIGGRSPDVYSLHPIVVSRFTTQTLNITGEYFDGDVQVKIIPPYDVGVGNIATVNADHTELSVDLNIGEYAELGQRVITVENLNGSSTSTALPSNTLTIVNGISGEVPVTSLPLGIVVESNSVQKLVSIVSPELSVVRGAAVTAVQPLKSKTDTTITLTIEGFELDNVTTINFEPDQGITVSSPQIAGDGLSLTADITIASDAETTSRKLSVLTASANLSFINPEVSQFLVLGPEPQIDYISPNFIVAGSVSTISVSGQAFDLVDSVRIEPSQGLTVSVPQINTEKTLITLQITSGSDLLRGYRTLIVGSTEAESSAVPSAANQLNVITAEVLTINSSLVSPLVGVLKDDGSAGATRRDLNIVSNLVGVFIPEQPVVFTETLYSQPLSVVKGGYLQTIKPDAIETGTTSPLTISGVGLQDVTAIEFLPADGLSLQSLLSINAEATEVNVDIAVAADAEKTVRRIVVFQNGNTDNALPYVKTESSIITIAGGLPVIESISPVLQVANSQFELLVRGQGLQEVTAVFAYDSNGVLESSISFGTPVVNIEATELRVTVVVERLVTAGEKAIVLTVPIGQTSTTATSVNTLTIDTLTN